MTAIEKAIVAIERRWRPLGVLVDADYDGESIYLGRLVVPKVRRCSGIGSRAMTDIAGLADRHRVFVTLIPTKELGADSVVRLRRFYRRFGFVDNRGAYKNAEISESMYRVPR